MKTIEFTLLLIFSHLSFSQNVVTWNSQSDATTSNFGNLHPRIVMDGSGNPLLIWGNMTDESVYFSRWNGNNFITPIKLNPAWLSVATSNWMGPDIAVKGDTVYVVVKQTPESSSNSHIYLIRSFDKGNTFSSPIQVDFIGDSISRFPAITIDKSGHPVVAFMKFDPSFGDSRWVISKSNDYGNTFMTDVKASNQQGGLVCDCCPGGITNSGDTIAMLYRMNNNNLRDSWVGISNDNATSFPSGFAIENNNWTISYCPSSGPDGFIEDDTLYSVFMNGIGGTLKTYLSKSSLKSTTLNSVKPLTENIMGLSSQNYPRISSDGSASAIVWRQVVNNVVELPILFTNDLKNGFPTQFDIVDQDEIRNADVALSNGTVFVVWEDDNSGTVKYRKGTFVPVNTSILESKTVNPFEVSYSISSRKNLFIPDGEKSHIEIFNTQGEIILREINKSTVNISSLSEGMYFLKINTSGKFKIGKFLVVGL